MSLHERAQQDAVLMHVRGGCAASAAAIGDYLDDAPLRAAVIPMTASTRSDFDREVCDLTRAALRERGAFWIVAVDLETACESLARDEARFRQAHAVVAFPQFSVESEVIDVFDDERLADAGVRRVVANGASHFEGFAIVGAE